MGFWMMRFCHSFPVHTHTHTRNDVTAREWNVNRYFINCNVQPTKKNPMDVQPNRTQISIEFKKNAIKFI